MTATTFCKPREGPLQDCQGPFGNLVLFLPFCALPHTSPHTPRPVLTQLLVVFRRPWSSLKANDRTQISKRTALLLPTSWALFVRVHWFWTRIGRRRRNAIKPFQLELREPQDLDSAGPASARAKAGPFFLGLSLPTVSWCSLSLHRRRQTQRFGTVFGPFPAFLSCSLDTLKEKRIKSKVEVSEKFLFNAVLQIFLVLRWVGHRLKFQKVSSAMTILGFFDVSVSYGRKKMFSSGGRISSFY